MEQHCSQDRSIQCLHRRCYDLRDQDRSYRLLLVSGTQRKGRALPVRAKADLSFLIYVLNCSFLSTLCNPQDCNLPGSSVHGDSPGKNIGVGCHALLQAIFPTQGFNPGLLHCRRILYCLEPPGKPFLIYKLGLIITS